MIVEPDEVAERAPRPLDPDELARIGVLLLDAEDLITTEFLRNGRSFEAELETVPWLRSVTRRVVMDMVGKAVQFGANAGVRSVSSTTGPQSDSITFADTGGAVFTGVVLTQAHIYALGLGDDGGPRGCFPPPLRWPERWR